MKKNVLVEIYLDYIKRQGHFDYGIDDLEKIGIYGILRLYGLDYEVLTEEEKEELEEELRGMAREIDFIRDYENEYLED